MLLEHNFLKFRTFCSTLVCYSCHTPAACPTVLNAVDFEHFVQYHRGYCGAAAGKTILASN